MSDLIDREYAIKKFCEYGTYLERHGVPIMTLCDAKQRAVDLIESLPSAQPEVAKDTNVPNNDCISRQALCEYALNQKDKCVTPNDIMRFPSAQPERKKGKWIIDNGLYRCSACNYLWSELWWAEIVPFEKMLKLMAYCPHCGADMRGESDE